MENKVNKEDAKKFLKETGYEFDSYIMTVVEMMLFNFAEQQVKNNVVKSNVRGSLIAFLMEIDECYGMHEQKHAELCVDDYLSNL